MSTEIPNKNNQAAALSNPDVRRSLLLPDHIRASAAAASGIGRTREKRRFSYPRSHRRVSSPAARAAAESVSEPPWSPLRARSRPTFPSSGPCGGS